jgi:hypothetical protein
VNPFREGTGITPKITLIFHRSRSSHPVLIKTQTPTIYLALILGFKVFKISLRLLGNLET